LRIEIGALAGGVRRTGKSLWKEKGRGASTKKRRSVVLRKERDPTSPSEKTSEGGKVALRWFRIPTGENLLGVPQEQGIQ